MVAGAPTAVPSLAKNARSAQVIGRAVSRTDDLLDVTAGWVKEKGLLAMNPWIAKAVVLAGTVVMVAIRAPHGRRSRSVKVVKSHKTPVETGVLVLAWVGFFIPLIWIASPAFSFAEYPLRTGPLIAGVMCFVIGLRLFYRSHADLGTNWSITLELREQHRLITQGVYRRIRHPMSSALVLYSVGQALVIPNWVVGGGEDDGPTVWRRIRRVHGTDEASCSGRLVDRTYWLTRFS